MEPHTMAVLSSRLDGIAAHMTHVVEQGARSSVMSTARDLSTAVTDASGAVLAMPIGMPTHVFHLSPTVHAVLERHGASMRPGDAFLNNSPYDGCTHMADHTIVVPVFDGDEPIFFCVVRGHQADIGNAAPTTYFERARDIYEEGGICFPCVRIQRDYQDVDDIIGIARYRIRCPDVWYGDYLAMVGAARIGERRLLSLLDTYGRETLTTFAAEWQEYGRQRMREHVAALPAGTWRNHSRHDPIPGLLPEGIDIHVRVTIAPEEGVVDVDLRGNGPPVACGLNLCEATAVAAARAGVMNRMPPDMPLCDGAMERIRVFLDDPGVVGKAALPFSSSVATTNLANRLLLAVQCVWSEIDEKLGMAEGNVEMGPGEAVISGHDSRYGRDYVTELLSGTAGGMAVYGHDGYVDYGPSGGGMEYWNPVEVVEQKYPVLYLRQELVPDSGGPGRWEGAPASRLVIATREDPVTFMYIGDGALNRPRGFAGGGDGSPTRAFRRDVATGRDEPLPMCHRVTLQPGEALVSECASGGGYGDPLERDPKAVLRRVEEGWTTMAHARDAYGVVLQTEDGRLGVATAATERLRGELRAVREVVA